jgi:hypothetical protein
MAGMNDILQRVENIERHMKTVQKELDIWAHAKAELLAAGVTADAEGVKALVQRVDDAYWDSYSSGAYDCVE